MKRKRIILFIGLLYVMMLVGCKKNDGDVSKNGTVGSETEMVPDAIDTIFSSKTQWDSSNDLYEVPLDVLDGVEQSQVYRFGNDLLFTYFDYDGKKQQRTYKMKLVSLDTGEVLCENELGAILFANVQILEKHVAVHDLEDGKCYLFDTKLELVDTYELSEGMFCLSSNAEKAYQFTYDRGITVIHLESGQSSVLLENAINIYMYEIGTKEVSFVYTDKETLLRCSGRLDLFDGQITTMESPYAYSGVETGQNTWIGKVDCDEPMYVLSDGINQSVFYSDLDEMIGVNSATGHVMISKMGENGEHAFCLYDNQGELISECEVNELSLFKEMDFAWYEEYEGYVFTLTDQQGQDHLMFWDVSEKNGDKKLDITDVGVLTQTPEGTAVSKELFDKAEALSEKYGVEILIADQCDTELTDHNAELLLDEVAIEQALNTLDYAMGRYPKIFFEQLKHNTYKEIEIQILGVLEKSYSTEEEIYISGGFVSYEYSGKILMALDARMVNVSDDINSIMEETMYHEFSHIIDRRLEFDSQQRTDAVYSDYGWTMMNPEGFEYNDSYYGTLNPMYSDYFVDAYACTNGTEDRARIMEYAMMGKKEVFTAKEGLAEKLKYYCEGIRDSFDTTGWPEELPWEESLK